MDTVYVHDIILNARIGIYEWEKRIQQKIRINLDMAWDNHIPATSDQIADALNYKTATKLVMQLVESQHFDLVERLAEEIAQLLMRELQIPWLAVQVGKPGAVRGAAEVGVRIERGVRPTASV